MEDINVNPPWICDQCGDPIETIQDGWVEWLCPISSDEMRGRSHGLRLVHRSRCMYDQGLQFRLYHQATQDNHLQYFLGSEGLMKWLAMIDEKRFRDTREVLTMIKRLFIPGYEQIRLVLAQAEEADIYEPNTVHGYPHMDQIEDILAWIDRKNTN